MSRVHRVYPEATENIIVLFDVRIPGMAEQFHRERAAWGERSDVEALDCNHYVLLIRPGGANGC